MALAVLVRHWRLAKAAQAIGRGRVQAVAERIGSALASRRSLVPEEAK